MGYIPCFVPRKIGAKRRKKTACLLSCWGCGDKTRGLWDPSHVLVPEEDRSLWSPNPQFADLEESDVRNSKRVS